MKMNKILMLLFAMLAAAPLYSQSMSPAISSKTTNPPKIEESDIVLKMPSQYYYFIEKEGEGTKQLHCYYPATKVDVTLDLEMYDFLSGVDAAWYDAANDNIYVAVNEGGMEIRELTVYKINSKNAVTKVMELEGLMPRAANDYTSIPCGADLHYGCVRIQGGGEDAYYSLSLKPIGLPAPSQIKLSPLQMGFVQVNTDGVNIRKEPKANAPRLGYFYCEKCQDTDYENPLLWEDDPEGKKPFTPYHPKKGEIFSYSKYYEQTGGWHPIGISDGYISAKFVEELKPERITINRKLQDQDRMRIVKDGKYAGLVIFVYEDMDGAQTLFGKIDAEGIVQFYGESGFPYYDGNIKGLKCDNEYNTFSYGPDYENKNFNKYECYPKPLDLNKLTTEDIGLLLSKGQPLNYELNLVGFPDGLGERIYPPLPYQ